MKDAVVVEQINILENQDRKYEVKLKTDQGEAYYYTDFRHQVGDTLLSSYEYFSTKGVQISTLSRKVDSLQKELNFANYYLSILRDKVVLDTAHRK